MSSEQGVYLTLPSNASMSLYPGNTLTNYITALPQRVRLEGQWECGLVEIQYCHSWYNVRRENAWFAVVSGSDHSVIRRGGSKRVTMTDRKKTDRRHQQNTDERRRRSRRDFDVQQHHAKGNRAVGSGRHIFY